MRMGWRRWRERLTQPPWDWDWSHLPWGQAALVRAYQILWGLGADLVRGGLTLRTTSLVYTTILSLVPLLALSFSVLKALGVHNQLEPVLLRFLQPLGPRSGELTARLIGFVENIQVGVLGAVGLGFLLFTVGSLIYKIENGFNYIWAIEEERSWPRRLSGYLSVILGGPVLVFTATGMTASAAEAWWFQALVSVEPFDTLATLAGQFIPFLLVVLAFTLIYLLIPNTAVHWLTALLGGAVAGLLWQLTGWAFGSFVATSARYTAIYSGFAIGLLFMIWLYLSWLILLVGARIAFYLQHPEYLGPHDPETPLHGRARERAGVAVMYHVAARYLWGSAPCTAGELADTLQLPRRPLAAVLMDLEAAGLLAATRDEPGRYLPARDPYRTPVDDVLDAVHRRPARGVGLPVRVPTGVEDLFEGMDRALSREVGERSLAELVEAS